MKIQPTQDRALVELEPYEKTFGESCITRPDIARDRPMWGEVKAIGPGVFKRIGKKDVFCETTLKVGDRVCVPWSTGHDIKINNIQHVVIREHDLLAIDDKQ